MGLEATAILERVKENGGVVKESSEFYRNGRTKERNEGEKRRNSKTERGDTADKQLRNKTPPF